MQAKQTTVNFKTCWALPDSRPSCILCPDEVCEYWRSKNNLTETCEKISVAIVVLGSTYSSRPLLFFCNDAPCLLCQPVISGCPAPAPSSVLPSFSPSGSGASKSVCPNVVSVSSQQLPPRTHTTSWIWIVLWPRKTHTHHKNLAHQGCWKLAEKRLERMTLS